MAKVSIITPAYNAKEFICQTIDSVQAQTFKDWEMIIVDDCSTDNTSVLVGDYAKTDSRIQLIKAPQNGGVANARNIGLEVAKGDYIAFLDSDDLWKPEKLERQLAFMEDNGYVFSYSDYQCFDSNSGNAGKIVKCPVRMRAKDILKNTAIFCVTVIVNRKKTGDFRMPHLAHTEDNCTWYEILDRGFVAYKIPEVLALYRTGNASLTKNKGKSAKLQWQTYRDYFHFSFVKSAYYFMCYALNAVKKQL